jgi:hypothetical protein
MRASRRQGEASLHARGLSERVASWWFMYSSSGMVAVALHNDRPEWKTKATLHADLPPDSNVLRAGVDTGLTGLPFGE